MRITALIFCLVLLMSCDTKKKDYTPVHVNIDQNEVTIKEVQQTSGYTYLLVQSSDEEFWMAVSKMDAEVGEKVYFVDAMEMQDFESKMRVAASHSDLIIANSEDTQRRVQHYYEQWGRKPHYVTSFLGVDDVTFSEVN